MVSCPEHFKTIQHVNKHEIVFRNLKFASRYLTDWGIGGSVEKSDVKIAQWENLPNHIPL